MHQLIKNILVSAMMAETFTPTIEVKKPKSRVKTNLTPKKKKRKK